MRYVALSLLSLALLAISARAEDAIPPEMVDAIKAATVFVKVEAEGGSGSGSGFVVKTEGNSAYVVTNHHVIEPKVLEIILVPGLRPGVPYRLPRTPGRPYYLPAPPTYTYTPRLLVRSFKNAVVTVVFHSGAKNEESIRGEILAADPEHDLAVLKVSGVKDLPKPIDYLHEPKLTETMPLYTFGFPFGKILATSKAGPAITVGKGSVSSLPPGRRGQPGPGADRRGLEPRQQRRARGRCPRPPGRDCGVHHPRQQQHRLRHPLPRAHPHARRPSGQGLLAQCPGQ